MTWAIGIRHDGLRDEILCEALIKGGEDWVGAR